MSTQAARLDAISETDSNQLLLPASINTMKSPHLLVDFHGM